MFKFKTMMSVLGSILLGQGVAFAWWILLFANIVWALHYAKSKNYEGIQLHMFYAINSLIAICM